MFKHVTPCFSASPDRGSTKPAYPGGIATARPVGTTRPPAARREHHVLARVEVVARVVGVLLRREAAARDRAVGLGSARRSVSAKSTGERGALVVGRARPPPRTSGWSTTMRHRARRRTPPAAAGVNANFK